MFQSCSRLVSGPEIRVGSGDFRSFYAFLADDPLLNSVKWTGSTIPSSSFGTLIWLRGVASTGTFVYTDPDLDVISITRDNDGVPPGWTIMRTGPGPSLVLSINGKSVKSLTINGKPVSKLG